MPPHPLTLRSLSNVSYLFYNSSLLCPSLCIVHHVFFILVSLLSGLVQSVTSSVHLLEPTSHSKSTSPSWFPFFLPNIFAALPVRPANLFLVLRQKFSDGVWSVNVFVANVSGSVAFSSFKCILPITRLGCETTSASL